MYWRRRGSSFSSRIHICVARIARSFAVSPPVACSTRRIKASEFEDCAKNGVTEEEVVAAKTAFDLFDDPVALLSAQNRIVLMGNGIEMGPPSDEEAELHRTIVAAGRDAADESLTSPPP